MTRLRYVDCASLNPDPLRAAIRGYLIDLTGVPPRASSRNGVHLRALSRLREHICKFSADGRYNDPGLTSGLDRSFRTDR